MTITDFIAFSAFVVATYSAFLSTYIAIKEFFRLKIELFNKDKIFVTLTKSDSYIQDAEGAYIDTFKKDLYSIIILVRLVNKSKYNVAINEIMLNNKYSLNSSANLPKYIAKDFSTNRK